MGAFTAKAAVKARNRQDLRRRPEVGGAQSHEVEGQMPRLALVDEGQRHDAHQQEGRSEERVDEELDRRIGAPGEAPAGDDEVHRHQGELEEQEEHDQVERHEAAEARRLEHEHPHHERPGVRPHLARQQHHGEQHRRHEDQEQRDPVHPEMPRDAERRRPFVLRDEAVPALPALYRTAMVTARAKVAVVASQTDGHDDPALDGFAQRLGHERGDEWRR